MSKIISEDKYGWPIEVTSEPEQSLEEADKKTMECPNCGLSRFYKKIDMSKPIPLPPAKVPMSWECTNCGYQKPIKYRKPSFDLPDYPSNNESLEEAGMTLAKVRAAIQKKYPSLNIARSPDGYYYFYSDDLDLDSADGTSVEVYSVRGTTLDFWLREADAVMANAKRVDPEVDAPVSVVLRKGN